MKISLSQILFVLVLFAALVLASVSVFGLYQDYKNRVTTEEPKTEQLVLKEEADILLSNSPSAGLPSTQGVNNIKAKASSLALPEGKILFSASLYGDQSFKVQNYRLNISGSLIDADKPDFSSYISPVGDASDWLVEVDDVDNPKLSFYAIKPTGVENQLDGHEEYPRSLIMVDTEDNTVNFEGVIESQMHSFNYASETGLLAFTAWKRYSNPLLFSVLDSWKIVILDTKTKVTKTINAAHNPLWLPGGNSLIYMKKNGVYFYDVATDAEIRLYALPADRNFYVATAADISADKSKLVLTLGRQVVLYDVSYAADGKPTISEFGRFETPGVEYYWPLFSPDSKFYALQAINVLDNGYRENPRIEIRALDGREAVANMWMGNFLFETTVLNAWIAD